MEGSVCRYLAVLSMIVKPFKLNSLSLRSFVKLPKNSSIIHVQGEDKYFAICNMLARLSSAKEKTHRNNLTYNYL